jgi:translocation and assembly module TamB
MLQPGAVEQKVGVMVRGTLRAPRVMLYSDPPLTQAQATNYLLFGTAGFETSANTVGGAPGGSQDSIPNFSTQVGGGDWTFDVSKQSVQTVSGTQASSLFVGKYLSPRLYVSYGVGLYDPIIVKRLIYKLSEKWTLQAESGTASSADIIYTLEH